MKKKQELVTRYERIPLERNYPLFENAEDILAFLKKKGYKITNPLPDNPTSIKSTHYPEG